MKAIAAKHTAHQDLATRRMKNSHTPSTMAKSPTTHLKLESNIVQRKPNCACDGGCPKCLENSGIQAKLKIGASNDKYEQEADRVAEQVMRMPEPKERETAKGETNTERTKSGLLAGNSEISIQRQEGDIIQAKAALGHAPQLPPNIASNIQNLKGGGQPLPANQRQFFESRMGQDFSGVRIHTDSKAADTAQTIQAKAFTLGNNIVFNRGQYSHDNQEGKKLLAHELTHIIQQKKLNKITSKIKIEKPKCSEEIQTELDSNRTNSSEQLYVSDTTKQPIIQRQISERSIQNSGVSVGRQGQRYYAEGLFIPNEFEEIWIQRMLEAYFDRLFPDWPDEVKERHISEAIQRPGTRWLHGAGPPAGDEAAMRRLLIPDVIHQNWLFQYLAYTGLSFERYSIITGLSFNLEVLRQGLEQSIDTLSSTARRQFISSFERRARTVTGRLLDQSEALLLSEKSRYINNPLDLRNLVFAAGNLSSAVDEVGRLENPTSPLPDELMEERLASADIQNENARRITGNFPILAGMNVWNRSDISRLGVHHRDRSFVRIEQLSSARQAIQNHVEDIRERINDVRSSLNDVDFDVWSYPRVIELTLEDMGIQNQSTERYWVELQRSQQVILQISTPLFFTVLAVAFALLSAITTGGASILFGLAALTVSGVDLGQQIQQADEQEDTSRIYFDRNIALSNVEPGYLWLALSIVGFFLEAVDFIRTANRLSQSIAASNRVRRSANRSRPEILGEIANDARREWRQLKRDNQVQVPEGLSDLEAENAFVANVISGARRDLDGAPFPSNFRPDLDEAELPLGPRLTDENIPPSRIQLENESEDLLRIVGEQDGINVISAQSTFYQNGYRVEIDVGNGVIYRRRSDGIWCRFNSPPVCNITVPDELDEYLRVLTNDDIDAIIEGVDEQLDELSNSPEPGPIRDRPRVFLAPRINADTMVRRAIDRLRQQLGTEWLPPRHFGTRLHSVVEDLISQSGTTRGWTIRAEQQLSSFTGLSDDIASLTVREFLEQRPHLRWIEDNLPTRAAEARSSMLDSRIADLRPDLVIRRPDGVTIVWDLTSRLNPQHLAKTSLYANILSQDGVLVQIGETYWGSFRR